LKYAILTIVISPSYDVKANMVYALS